jgi:hypothetical protein
VCQHHLLRAIDQVISLMGEFLGLGFSGPNGFPQTGQGYFVTSESGSSAPDKVHPNPNRGKMFANAEKVSLSDRHMRGLDIREFFCLAEEKVLNQAIVILITNKFNLQFS